MSTQEPDVQTSTGESGVLATIQSAVAAFNATAGEGERLDFAALKERIRKLGGISDELLKLLRSEADLVECGLPRLLARQILLQIEADTACASESQTLLTFDSAATASVERLVRELDPALAQSPAAVEIKKRVSNSPCIVYDLDDGGGIHRKLTAQIVQELVEGEPVRSHVIIRGRPQPIFRIGEQPPRFADEHPLFPGKRLRKDGTCDLGLNWREGISKEKRMVIYLAVSRTKEIRVRDNDHVRELHRILKNESENQIRERYTEASMLFSAGGDLPTMKVQVSTAGSFGGGGNDPFFGRHRKY